jgi:two-component system NtrC family sensor kinase
MKTTTPSLPRILVIDDNRAIHEDFRKIFDTNVEAESLDAAEASLFGETVTAPKATFRIDSAYQGREGLELVQKAVAQTDPYAMAFVDVRMPPGWDGIETISHIWNVYPDLQVVICTAYSDYSWEDMHQKLGDTDRLVILKKPFDNVEVLQLAGALTEKWRLLQQTRKHTQELEETIAKRTEQLRKSEERFRLITENVADLIAITDRDGQRLYNSPSYERLLGYHLDDLRSTLAFAEIHPEDRERVVAAAHKTTDTGVGAVLEYRMKHKDGSWRTLESHGAPFRNANGEIEGVLTVARDITERRQADQERQMMEVQLRQAQKLESIGRLAAGVAHEINTPTQYIGDNTKFVRDSFTDLLPVLNAPRQLIEAARANGLTPEMLAATEELLQKADVDYLLDEIPKAVEQSLQGVERVAKIVRAMKEFSHPGTADKTQVDLNHCIESTLTVARNEWKYVADLVTEFDPSLPPVTCLPGEFNQVILNLVVNAAHAIGDTIKEGESHKGTITVTTKLEGDWAEVRLRDTGTGIPESARGKIFDPFFTTKGVGKGTGQGLAIAHSVIVDKHGGTIDFETELGKGTVFIIRLPLTAKEPSLTAATPANIQPGK